jgi:predicted CXXCH cytochrome family protein
MTQHNDHSLPKPPARWRRLAVVAGAAGLLWAAISCTTVTRTVVIPPNIPGAKFVGSKECEVCHEDIYRDFKTASHARLQAKGPNAINMGCESCHGPGSLHVETAGERKTANYAPGKPHVLSGAQRLTIINPRRSSANCYDCHLDKRGSFELPYHHAVPEARMSCGDCHDPHKGPAARGGMASRSYSDTCLKCHDAQHGPYVFEHEAMREGCITCHEPHGSVNPKMLVARNSNLCLKCHFQQVTPGKLLIGGVDHKTSLQQGACWTAGCHEAVHGSRVNASLRF